jgi:hypothetical protein
MERVNGNEETGTESQTQASRLDRHKNQGAESADPEEGEHSRRGEEPRESTQPAEWMDNRVQRASLTNPPSVQLETSRGERARGLYIHPSPIRACVDSQVQGQPEPEAVVAPRSRPRLLPAAVTHDGPVGVRAGC